MLILTDTFSGELYPRSVSSRSCESSRSWSTSESDESNPFGSDGAAAAAAGRPSPADRLLPLSACRLNSPPVELKLVCIENDAFFLSLLSFLELLRAGRPRYKYELPVSGLFFSLLLTDCVRLPLYRGRPTGSATLLSPSLSSELNPSSLRPVLCLAVLTFAFLAATRRWLSLFMYMGRVVAVMGPTVFAPSSTNCLRNSWSVIPSAMLIGVNSRM